MDTLPVKWTLEALKEYFDRLREIDREAIQAALEAAKTAVIKAENAAEKRFEGLNEFRNTFSDQQKTFIPRNEFEAYKLSVEKALGLEKERGDIRQGKGLGLSQGWGVVLAAIGLVSTVIGIFIALNK